MARVSIEDCLKKISNRFVLVGTATHRARQLMDNEDSLVRSKNREAVTALREIAEGQVVSDFDENKPVEQEAPELEVVASEDPLPTL